MLAGKFGRITDRSRDLQNSEKYEFSGKDIAKATSQSKCRNLGELGCKMQQSILQSLNLVFHLVQLLSTPNLISELTASLQITSNKLYYPCLLQKRQMMLA